MLDFLQPLYYRLEKRVAGKTIPAVHNLPGRLRLADLPRASGPPFDHSAWDRCLKKHTTAGGACGAVTGVTTVDYAGLATDRDFDAYLEALATAKVDALVPTEQLALHINAYNALCCAKIVAHERAHPSGPPLGSILQLTNQEQGKVWDQPAGVLGGAARSLNDIEHGLLRARWDEPAVHASIVCASASCPNLRREAFVGARVGEQMQSQLADWLSNESKGVAAIGPSRVLLSRIFLWFEDDFGGKTHGGVRAYLRRVEGSMAAGAAAALASTGSAIRYFEYDWTLNRTPK